MGEVVGEELGELVGEPKEESIIEKRFGMSKVTGTVAVKTTLFIPYLLAKTSDCLLESSLESCWVSLLVKKLVSSLVNLKYDTTQYEKKMQE